MESRSVSFLTFFLMWAKQQGWKVPHLHVRICSWLETCTESERVLMVFRGAAKSTIYAVYKAWKLYRNRHHRSLVWSADGPTAGMLTADVVNVLRNHPLTGGMLPPRPGRKLFWVNGARDARNASMRAVGVDSNATGARADAVDYDDVEVPGNVETPEARAHLRKRISEATHIAVPGAQKTLIGTPHAHDSIYPERIAGGAAVLKIPLFAHMVRFKDTDTRTRYAFDFEPSADGLYVMVGIHKGAELLEEGRDYRIDGREVVFDKPPRKVLDICAGCAWPEYFTRKEIALRRRETLTFNAWDSQYQLEAKPLGETRLDPARMIEYGVEPQLVTYRGETRLMLGRVRIVSASMRWDPSTAKLNSDVSALCLMLQDEKGNNYWHRAISLSGDIAKLDTDGKIVGGQVWEICDVVDQLSVPRVTIETNGLGETAPALLTAALNRRGIQCGVEGKKTTGNKNLLILEAFDGPLSGGYLWAHSSVIDAVADQMRSWNPAVREQPDDFLDAGGAALRDEPVRIGHLSKIPTADPRQDWRPEAGSAEVEIVYAD